MPTVTVESFQNEYLPDGGTDASAVIAVTSTGGGARGPAENAAGAELIIVDVSGSMRGRKLRQAIAATSAAIGVVRDGVEFAVIGGNHQARVVYPPAGGLAVAGRATRSEAQAALRDLSCGGGTAIGRWLTTAAALLDGHPGPAHAILLTDGKDESEKPADLRAALDVATGVFQCDCRGVGTDWVVAELRSVADALLGGVDIVAEPDGLVADFTTLMATAMGRRGGDVTLRVWTPAGASVSFVKQVAPEVVDLSGLRVEVNPMTGDYPTGAWGDESRDYHVGVRVPAQPVGEEMLAARVTVLVDGGSAGQALVRAVWTDDSALSTRINRQVAHYTGQAELAAAIQEGLEARRSGDDSAAAAMLGRAVQLAAASGNSATSELLEKVVDVDDAATGRVRLKAVVPDADEMTLDTRSTKTVRVRR